MKGSRKQALADKKELILAAAEQIMREEGYAAVSSRRVAERAGSKSLPIHYHFGTMEELFFALYRRSEEKYFARLVQVLSSTAPLHRLWELGQDPAESGLVGEYLALANHRESVRHEVARSGEQVRMIASAIVASGIKVAPIDFGSLSPSIIAFILEAICRTLVSDRALGISCGHDEVVAFVDGLLDQAEPARPRPSRRPAQGQSGKSSPA
jgi:AcrR family transcriptional regulator